MRSVKINYLLVIQLRLSRFFCAIVKFLFNQSIVLDYGMTSQLIKKVIVIT